MTEPQTGPAGEPREPAQPEPQPGGPPMDTGSGSAFPSGTGGRPAGSTSSSTTTGTGGTMTRTSGQTNVPQQYGRRPERGAEGEYEPADTSESDERYIRPGLSTDNLIAATAGRAWPAVLAGGLGLIALGIILLVWPRASLTIVAILIGAALVVSGLVRLAEGFTAHDQSGGMRAAYVVIGLLAVLAGLYCLRHHALSLFLVAFVTGVYFIAHGISDIGVAVSARVPGRVLRGVLGVFAIAAGIIMVVWPGITLILLLTLVAAWLLFYGCVLCAISFSLMRASRTAKSGSSGNVASSRRLAASAR